MTIAVGILLCAGGSTRMGFDKLTTPIAGKTAIERSLDALVFGGVSSVVFTASEQNEAYVSALPCPVPRSIVRGGETRAESVKKALDAIQTADVVVIHDAARCMVAPKTVEQSIESAMLFGSGVVAQKASDTVLLVGEDGLTAPNRDDVLLMQTPQTFRFASIKEAYAGDLSGATDDCSVFIRMGGKPRFVMTEPDTNRKLTQSEDWLCALSRFARFGTGFDTHRLAEGRKLILGGVEIPFEKGLLGHSDADVLTHAVMDALLGAAGLGDIGQIFPDSDASYEGISSLVLLARVNKLLCEKGFSVSHIDATVIAQRPKLMPFIPRMRVLLAKTLAIGAERVSIKATTTEGMNDEGKGLCISASAIAAVV